MFFINLVLVDQKTIRDLNKKYRKIDQPTTVLSFYYGGKEIKKGAGPICLGEIFICPAVAKKQNLSLEELANHGFKNLLSEISPAEISRLGFTSNQSRTAKSRKI